ncbi:MAG: outer membrane protein assembly factor BamA, partial [Thermodesulfobacteriota bacterium]|nr:outer membrane protein assembly factor BamA [Thermodesulfobacteriota bacterium]
KTRWIFLHMMLILSVCGLIRPNTSLAEEKGGMLWVDSVLVEGNQRIEEAAILAVVKTRKGDELNYDQLNKDLRDIYQMGYFTDVRIKTKDGPEGTIVVFSVTEKPSIGKIAFKGNKSVDAIELEKELGIDLYSILDHTEVRQSINRLMDFYRKKGYYNMEIKERIKPLPNNEVLLEYEIAEHDKVYIRKIEFLGNSEFDDDDLKDIMETSEKGFFSWITDKGFLDKKKLEFDVHQISSFYHNNGFIKARVGEPKIVFEKNKGLKVTIEIEEGHRYTVNDVDIEGDLSRPVEELLGKVEINKGDAFSRETVRKDIQTLRNVYVDEGYAYAEVSPSTKEDSKTHLVDITFSISKGQKVRFERVNIIGNTSTRDKVIRRELKAIEGEDFSGEAIRRSTQNLHRLGFFENVEMETRKGSSDDLIVLDVNIEERPTGSFSVGAGYSSVDSAFVVFQVSQNNLLGRGQKLETSAKLGGRTTQFNVKFIEPWLFDRHISAGIDIYKWEQEYDDYTEDGYEYDDYSRDSLGAALSIGFPLDFFDEFTRGSVRYGYDDADISDVPETASIEIKDMEGRNVTSSVTFGIKRDSRDRPWNTSRGSVNSLTFEYAGGVLGGDVYFNKYLARSAWFIPMFWDTVFLIQGSWGYIEERSGGKLPVYQKFRLGGINSVRGFDYADISPHDPDTGDKIGGEKMMVYNLEYRFPLFKEQGIVGLTFFDLGNVFEKGEDYSFSGIRSSVGCGIRWYSPMGPLRIEYGKNLDPRGDEPSGNWEFTVGGLL